MKTLFGIALVATAFVSLSIPQTSAEASTPSAVAVFEGRLIRLADGWGDATACFVDTLETRCYRTGAELQSTERGRLDGPVPMASCSTSVVLSNNTGYGGSQIFLSTRGTYIALSLYGFDNLTSSYQIGACSARFYDGGGGSTQYPGSTAAGVSAASMVSGWDNRVSTVYIL